MVRAHRGADDRFPSSAVVACPTAPPLTAPGFGHKLNHGDERVALFPAFLARAVCQLMIGEALDEFFDLPLHRRHLRAHVQMIPRPPGSPPDRASNAVSLPAVPDLHRYKAAYCRRCGWVSKVLPAHKAEASADAPHTAPPPRRSCTPPSISHASNDPPSTIPCAGPPRNFVRLWLSRVKHRPKGTNPRQVPTLGKHPETHKIASNVWLVVQRFRKRPDCARSVDGRNPAINKSALNQNLAAEFLLEYSPHICSTTSMPRTSRPCFKTRAVRSHNASRLSRVAAPSAFSTGQFS